MFKIEQFYDFYWSDRSVTVTFYISFNGQAFPDNQWTDFAVIVLNWWLSEIQNSLNQDNARFSLTFMDGPYYVDCSKHGSMVHMDFIEEKREKKILGECDIEAKELLAEVARASSKILETFRHHIFRKPIGFVELKRTYRSLGL